MSYNIIVIKDKSNIIGYKNHLVYNIPDDMALFKSTTTKVVDISKINAIVMGRKTWESLPDKHKPLKKRLNVVLTRNNKEKINEYIDNNKLEKVWIRDNFENTIEELKTNKQIEQIFVIGGSELYKQAIQLNDVDKLYITNVNFDLKSVCENHEHLSYFPQLKNLNIIEETEDFSQQVKITHEETITRKISYSFTILKPRAMDIFKSINHEESEYLKLLKDVIANGSKKITRNGTTLSLFGKRMEFDLTNGKIPILTTKKMAVKTVIKELLWFISGDTSNETLKKQNVRIWNGNSSKEYLNSIGLTNRRR